MQNLNPTLWRTCKMLAGRARIRLLRQLHDHPEECVSALGERVALKEAAASQELRRIQSRGLLQAERRGVRLVYRLAADPQVASAAPLLKALQTAFDACPAERDADMVAIAAGLAHERRIRIVRTLLEGRPHPARPAVRHADFPASVPEAFGKTGGRRVHRGRGRLDPARRAQPSVGQGAGQADPPRSGRLT